MSFIRRPPPMRRSLQSMGEVRALAGTDCGCGCKGRKGVGCGTPTTGVPGGMGAVMYGIPGRVWSRSAGLAGMGDVRISSGIRQGLGDAAAVAAATTPPADLNSMVAGIQATAQRYVEQDRQMRYMQIAATLLIPFAALVTKTILHLRKGEPLL